MKKFIFAALAFLAAAGVVNASMIIPNSDRAKERSNAPEHSAAISETAGGEWDLERVDFIHYAKPDRPAKPGKSPVCYKLMGVQWKSLPVGYYVNPANQSGLSENFILNVLANSITAWDEETSSGLFGQSYADYGAQYGVQDYKNAIVFGNYANSNVIAITSVWFTRKNRQIVEFDMLFNEKFAWGNAEINPLLMDLENIATHEFGHALGLDDVYDNACAAVSMYGYASEGETAKRTLEIPDIKGLQSVYGL